MLNKFVVVTLFASICLPSAMAQIATGTYPHGSFDNHGPDTINVGNLNVHLSIPVLHKAGRGLPFLYDLNYDSSVWYPSTANGANSWTPVSLWGWKGSTDAVTGFITYISSTDTQPDFGGAQTPDGGMLPTCTTQTYSNWTYYDSIGTAHQFDGQTSRLIAGDYDTCPAGTDSFTESALDGSGFTMNVTWMSNATISTAHGQQLSPPVSLPGGAGVVTDTNGNQLSVDANGNFKDTTGNSVLAVSGNAPSPKTLSYHDASGNTQSVVVTYATHTVQTSFGCSGVAEYPATANSLVDRVTFPDGSFYAFTYEPTPGHSSSVTGRVASVVLPTGATVHYNYTGANSGIVCDDGGTVGFSRTMDAVSGSSASTVTYSRSFPGGGINHTEVTDGLGDKAEYDFMQPNNLPDDSASMLYPTRVLVYQGAASGTPLVTTQNCYNSDTPPCTSAAFSLPITGLNVYSSLDNRAQTLQSISYDGGSGAFTGQQSSDFGSSSPGPMLVERDVDIEFEPSGLVLPNSDVMKDLTGTSGGQVFSVTNYAYDQTGLQASSGVPAHVPVGYGRGNLTSTTVTASPSTPYQTYATYEDTGSIVSSTDPVNGTTTYGYDSTFVYLTSATPPTPASGANLSTAMGYDTVNTGLPTSVSNPNNTVHIHSYDAMLRPTEVDYPDGGSTTYTYAPTQTGQHHAMSAGTADTEYFLDGYGRGRRTAVAANGGTWYLKDTCYDSNGRVQFVSYRYQSSSSSSASVCTGAGDSYTYDALGRVKTVTHASSPSTQAASYYLGRTTKTVDENGVTKLTQVDGLGRISAVCEVTGTTLPNSGSPVDCGMDIAGSGYLTTYTYSLANHTTTINQGSQQRIFQTDWIGRLVSVQEPESGITTYAYSSNSTGMVVTRVKPQANQSNAAVTTTTTTQYDKANRVLSITYTDGTPTKTYNYDQPAATAGGGANLGYSKGMLTSYAVGATQGFIGYDSMGRVNLVTACQPANCGSAAYTSQAYTYDYAGNLMTAGDGAGRTVNYTYTLASEPLSATNTPASGPATTLVSSAQYGPFGANYTALGNGLTAVNGYDALGAPNAKWLCANSSSANCSGGTQTYGMSATWSGGRLNYSWDSVLNQQSSYGYDDMNRLSSRNVAMGTAQNFTYSYDRWGNRVSQIAAQTGPTVTTAFNTATNQIQSVAGRGSYTYDAAGNVHSDGVNTYSYDAEGTMTGVSGIATYTYNGLNQRVETVTPSGTQQFLFHPSGQRSATLDASGNALSEQIYFGSQPVAFLKSGTFHYQQQDWLGTERLRTSSTGSVEGTYVSLPFGDYASTVGTDQDPSHFTGLDSDTETQTSHATFRQYASNTGTWMGPDPYMGSYDATNPQSLNRYGYVMDSPQSFTDPTGLDHTEYSTQGNCIYMYNVTVTNSFDNGVLETDASASLSGVFCGGGVGTASNTADGGGVAPSNPGVRSCVGANFAQRAAVRLLSPLAAKTGATIGYGVGGSIGAGGIGPFGFNFAASQQLLVSPDGTAGLATTYTKQLFSVASKGFGGIVGFQAAFSNAKTFTDNAGLSIDAGIMAADEVGAALDVTNSGATVTVGAGFGGRGHAGTFTYTVVTPFCSGG